MAAVLGLDSADKGALSAVSGQLKKAFDIGNVEIGLLLAVVAAPYRPGRPSAAWLSRPQITWKRPGPPKRIEGTPPDPIEKRKKAFRRKALARHL